MMTACVSQSQGAPEERRAGRERGGESVTLPVAERQPPTWAPQRAVMAREKPSFAPAEFNPDGSGRRLHQRPLPTLGVSSRDGCGALQALKHHSNSPAYGALPLVFIKISCRKDPHRVANWAWKSSLKAEPGKVIIMYYVKFNSAKK